MTHLGLWRALDAPEAGTGSHCRHLLGRGIAAIDTLLEVLEADPMEFWGARQMSYVEQVRQDGVRDVEIRYRRRLQQAEQRLAMLTLVADVRPSSPWLHVVPESGDWYGSVACPVCKTVAGLSGHVQPRRLVGHGGG